MTIRGSEVVEVFGLFAYSWLEFLLFLFFHLLQRDKFEFRNRTDVGFSEIVNARMTIDNKRLINALVVIFLRGNVCRWIVRVLSHLHKKVNSENLFWWKVARVTIVPVVERVVFIFEIPRRKYHFTGCQSLLIAPLGLPLYFYVVIDINDGAKFFNFYNIRFFECVLMIYEIVKQANNVEVLKRTELLIVYKFKALHLFVSLNICDDFLWVTHKVWD